MSLGRVVTITVDVLLPAGTVTVDGTVANSALLLDMNSVWPFSVAAELSVTVAVMLFRLLPRSG